MVQIRRDLRYARDMPSSAPTPRERFAALVRAPDHAIDLAEAALLIAAEAYPDLDVARYTNALDELADGARAPIADAASEAGRARALVQYLSVERRFRGNQDNYYDKRNSFLNEVLDRRTGLPITLALVYMEVARRLGLPVHGVGFPGHFLTKYAGETDIIIDPFFGQILSERDCAQRLQAVLGPEAQFDRRLLRAAAPKEILVRMLRNLKQVHIEARELEPALADCERILLVEPDLVPELRDRGLLYRQLECWAPALADLERFLALAPDDPTADAVRDQLIDIRSHARLLH